MGKLSPKIKLMIKLQEGFRRVHAQYAIYADTQSNLSLSLKQRQLMSTDQLRRLSIVGVPREDDIYLYTTRHYFYGMLIQKLWRQLK